MIDHLAEPTDEHPSGNLGGVGHQQANEPIPRVLVIEHEPTAGPGRVGQWLECGGGAVWARRVRTARGSRRARCVSLAGERRVMDGEEHLWRCEWAAVMTSIR